MKPLYEISNRYQNLISLLNESDDNEISDESVSNAIELVESEIMDKVINISAVIKNLENRHEGLKERENSIRDKRKRIEKSISNIKSYLISNMQRCGIERIESDLFNVVLRNNPEKVVVESEEDIPPEYWRVKKIAEVDKELIRRDIKKGIDVIGARLVKEQSIIIK